MIHEVCPDCKPVASTCHSCAASLLRHPPPHTCTLRVSASSCVSCASVGRCSCGTEGRKEGSTSSRRHGSRCNRHIHTQHHTLTTSGHCQRSQRCQLAPHMQCRACCQDRTMYNTGGCCAARLADQASPATQPTGLAHQGTCPAAH